MDEQQPSTRSVYERFSKPLDLEAIKGNLLASEEGKLCKYFVGTPFCEDSIDRTDPRDRCFVNNQWFVSGYIVERKLICGEKRYSQIIFIYRSSTGLYYASLADLEPCSAINNNHKPFEAKDYRFKSFNDNLHEVHTLKVVDGAPLMAGYLDVKTLELQDHQILGLKHHLKSSIEDQILEQTTTLPDFLIKNCKP